MSDQKNKNTINPTTNTGNPASNHHVDEKNSMNRNNASENTKKPTKR